MIVPTDPVVLVLVALALWGLWAACVYVDAKSSRGGPLIRRPGVDMSGPVSGTSPARSVGDKRNRSGRAHQ